MTLTFPHCAENMKENWNVTIMKRDSNLQDPNVLTDVGFEDVSERSITDNEINLKSNHYTLYTCIGESERIRLPLNVSTSCVLFLACLQEVCSNQEFIV